MTRTSYLLFALMLAGLSVSLILYNQSRNSSRKFNERAFVVNTVLVLLERTEKLEHRLRDESKQTLNNGASDFSLSIRQKSEIDSILSVLHQIVLYDDQRARIDTIKNILNANFECLLHPRDDTGCKYDESFRNVILRAQTFANWRLKEQLSNYENHEKQVTFWVTIILTISFSLFFIGILSTLAENISKKKLKLLHESILTRSEIGICVFEINMFNGLPDFKVVFRNYGALIKINGKEDQFINLDSLRLDRDFAESIKVVGTTGKSIVKEYSHGVDGGKLWFLINLSKVAMNHVAFCYQDITRIKEFEAELKSKVAELEMVNKELEQFAHATSHDLQEPFRKIQIMTDIILTDHKVENNIRYLEAIKRASDKGSKLVEQILNYSKMQFDKSKLEEVDLNKTITQIIENFDLLILEKGAEVRTGRLPIVFANPVQMFQLFSNLIGNALKFSAQGRVPVITISCREINGNEVPELAGSHTYFEIIVQDNGIGIDEAFKEKIFNSFERLNNYTEFPGFGLGLSLCKRIVLNHEGKISVASEEGVGSQFYIYLPREKNQVSKVWS